MARYFQTKDYERTVPVSMKLLKFLWGMSQPMRLYMWVALVVMLLATGFDLIRPYLMKVAIDSHMQTGNIEGLAQLAALYAASIGATAMFSYIQTVLLQYIGQTIILGARQKIFRHLLYRPYAELEGQPVGRMVTRVTNDTDALKELYTDVIVSFASNILTLIGIMLVMLALDWRLALVSYAMLPLMVASTLLYQRYARLAYRLVREKTALVNSFVQENLNGAPIVKAFARFQITGEEFRKLSDQYLAAGLKEMRTFAIFRPLVDLIYTLAVAMVLWLGGWDGKTGLEIGVLVAFLRYVEKFFWPIRDLAEKFGSLQSALAAAERVYDLLAEEPSPEMTPCTEPLGTFRGSVSFEDVWFAYQNEDWVLRGVTINIEPGEFAGVVGLSGSGKTTLVNLLLRFYEPQRGVIRLDGIDIRDLPLPVIRRKVGVVFQDVHLFQGSIADNISLYHQEISRSSVESASRIASLHATVAQMPQGYDTLIGYQGALLSAGQRQLLSLARALASQPDILVLDEATSNIDSQTEQHVQEALAAISEQRTILAVAHRLSTIQQADKIFVMSRGRVAEAGRHADLLAKRGLYFRLYSSQ
ncbi:ABC transporter [Anaerosporomusa subterranea]|uniref:ABC transporter n=1 Tax=Anaerosporomusa subterranea TaxID=1794912 RepID=A0A154BMA0_ANASB|nr:ABC transporter ATP-binding protein [Anaerosporomusa subterranea]KYZ75046.1 ABC transporter [Anaerosporomusa subterranea]